MSSSFNSLLDSLKWVWNNRQEAAKLMREVRAWWRGKAKVLVLGPGGVGKSTLGRMLQDDWNPLLDLPDGYVESTSLENYSKLKDRPYAELVVAPGQPYRRELFWRELEDEMSKGVYDGVILVMANGYHSLGSASLGWKEHPLAVNHSRKHAFVKAYAEQQRLEELTILQRFERSLPIRGRKLWLITLVTKQDLWWNRSDEVKCHYRADYWDCLQRILAKSKTGLVQHEFWFGSLTIASFRDAAGIPLVQNQAGYGHAEYLRGLRGLFELLEAVRKWGAKK